MSNGLMAVVCGPHVETSRLMLAVAAEEERATAPGQGPPYYLGAGLLVLLLLAVHLRSPKMRSRLSGYDRIVSSFGGGMAAAYVFLHLIPELEKGHELLGGLIFLVPLVGLVTHFLIQRLSDRLSGGERSTLAFNLKLANLFVYSCLMVYATPEAGIESGWRATPIMIALVLHVAHTDYSFGREFEARFDALGGYVLAAAVLIGYATIVVEQRTNEAVTDILTAFLAGGVLFNVFREEIPDERKSSLGWFVCGIAVFALMAAYTVM